ncbi:MAG: GntR family transcriptional regulator [Pseudomonadales bacterium]|nr:GntR family transcriptional regulator [Pseudomonadales bacterium]MDP6471974.1 GntR family transcriptional regulator [Pseudomonadales bacterium]MDP6826755.1 GntR family transcriptional regulator [Pseudomonadales bacterium]MDP6971014.1 GntR family transcriptional regulator [Pseudomonadales bacterium]
MVFRQNVNLTEQIADHIGFGIITGALAPDTRIRELRVARELDVSRGSVREALLILASRHLIEIIPRRGAIVTGLQPEQIPGFSELFTELLTMVATRLARSSGWDTEPVREAVCEMHRAVRDEQPVDVLRLLIVARGRYLEALVANVDDRFLCSVTNSLIPVSQRLTWMVTHNTEIDAWDIPRFYDALLAALAGGDEVRVCELVSAYGRREKRMALGCNGN